MLRNGFKLDTFNPLYLSFHFKRMKAIRKKHQPTNFNRKKGKNHTSVVSSASAGLYSLKTNLRFFAVNLHPVGNLKKYYLCLAFHI
jgi:hypothetical protein